MKDYYDYPLLHISTLPFDFLSDKDLVILANDIHKYFFKSSIMNTSSTKSKMYSLYVDKDIDVYTVPFAIVQYFKNRGGVKPFHLTVFSDQYFDRCLEMAYKDLYSFDKSYYFHFSKFLYWSFPLFHIDKKAYIKYESYLAKYEDLYNAEKINDLKEYKNKMEEIVDEYR